MSADVDRRQIADEAKAIVALAFRNGPIETAHAGTPCPTCTGHDGISRITDLEMALIMMTAVDRVYELLLLKATRPNEYAHRILYGLQFTRAWDEPEDPRA